MWKLVALVLCLMCGAAAASPTITKNEARHAPPEWVIARVLRQAGALIPTLSEKDRAKVLGDLTETVASDPDAGTFAPQSSDPTGLQHTLDAVGKIVTIWPDPFTVPHPRYPLRELELQTRAHAARLPGLCVADFIILKFDPVEENIGPATRVKASEIFVDRWYHVLARPTAPEPAAATHQQRTADDANCKALNWDNDHFFKAADEKSAVRGVWIANTVNAGLLQHPMPFAFACEDTGSGQQDCLKWLRPGFMQPQSVGPCAGEVCNVTFSSFDFDVALDGPSTERIRSVVARSYVVVADALAD